MLAAPFGARAYSGARKAARAVQREALARRIGTKGGPGAALIQRRKVGAAKSPTPGRAAGRNGRGDSSPR
eukprot:201896-Pleurochrysis_carterae.AAC.1